MVKHTQGPWALSEVKAGYGVYAITWDTQGYILPGNNIHMDVCRVGSCYELEYASNTIKDPIKQKEIALANARLIAAAPELLEALINAIDYVPKAQVTALTMARAAIAKAKNG